MVVFIFSCKKTYESPRYALCETLPIIVTYNSAYLLFDCFTNLKDRFLFLNEIDWIVRTFVFKIKIKNILQLSDSSRGEPTETQPITKVLSFLFLGNSKDSNDPTLLATIGVTHVLNVTTSEQVPDIMDNSYWKIVRKVRLPVLDNQIADLQQHFDVSFEFIGNSEWLISDFTGPLIT